MILAAALLVGVSFAEPQNLVRKYFEPQTIQANQLLPASEIDIIITGGERDELESYGEVKRQIGEGQYTMSVSSEDYQNLKNNQEYKVEIDLPVHAFLNDSLKLVNITRVQAGRLSGTNITGAGQTICILDTGVNYTHLDLGGCFGNGTNSSCKVFAGFDIVNNDGDPYDDQGHGTHVAGIAAANGTSLRGAAPDARIVAVKVLDSGGGGTVSNIVSGINWCAGNASTYNISVISMSLGTSTAYTSGCDGEADLDSMVKAVNNATALNISIIAATGNDALINAVNAPACIANVTAIGATDKNNTIATYSNLAALVDLLAPGTLINSTDYAGGYSKKSGTSMSAPLAAGSFALVRQIYKEKFNLAPAPINITERFNRTGVQNIIDVGGLKYTKIDVLGALSTFDMRDPWWKLNSPPNGTSFNRSAAINLSLSDDVGFYYGIYSRNGTANASIPQNGQINTTGWPLGNQTVEIHFWDIFDKYNTTSFRFDVLNNAPILSNVTVNPASATKSNNLTCNYTYSDANSDAEQKNATITRWYLNGTINSTFENLSNINTTFVVKLQQWICEVTVFDGVNFSTTVNSTNVTISDIAPNVGVVYPNTTAKVSGIIQLNASATDEDGQSDIDIVYFYYTNSSTWTLIGNVTSGSGQYYNFTWNTSAIADGAGHQIRASAFDGINTTNATSAVSFVINNVNEKPTVTVTAPNGGESWGGTKTITWTASDPDNETLTVTLYYSKNSGVNWTQIASGEANDGSYDWDTKTVGNANSYRINVSVVDSGSLSSSDMSNSDFTVSNSADSGGGGGGSTTGGGDAGTAAGGGGAGLGGNQAGSTYATVAAGDLLTLDVTKDLAITNVELTSKSTATNVKLTVEKFDEQPSALPSPIGVAYKFSEIKAANLPSDAFDSVTIKFKVPKAWIKENKIDEGTILLQRYSGGWQELSTTKTGEDSDNLRFTATSPGLSFFTITGKKVLTEEIPIETESLSETNATETAAGGLATGLSTLKLPKLDLTGFTSAIGARPYFLPNGLWVLVGVLVIVLAFYGIAAARKPRTPKDVFRRDIQKKYGHEMKALKAGREGAQKFFGGMLKWAFTDTKQAKQIEEQRKLDKNKNKERPDFGF